AVCDDAIHTTLKHAKTLADAKIFLHDSKLTPEIAAFVCLGAILYLLIPAINAKHQGSYLRTKHELSLDLLGFDQ
ncbi:hypothetical protein, partial [Moraxella porci]|uniref:hypothetical protein n=1 Tax=Moraxella porci TaxID=1288392 RepID=UPI00244D3B29